MPKNLSNIAPYLISSFMLLFIATACAPDISCPTGQKEAKELFMGAETGKGTEKKRTENGLIKKKNPKTPTKRR